MLSMLATFTGCWKKGSDSNLSTSSIAEVMLGQEDAKPLVFLGKDKEPVLTVSEFNKYLVQIMKMYPQLGSAADVDKLPVAFKKNFLNKIIEQKLIIREALANKYENGPEFKKALEESTKLLKDHLLMQEFEKRLMNGIQISEGDLKAEYNNNKTKYIKEQGGALVAGVKFENNADSNTFLAKSRNVDSPKFSSLAVKETAGQFKNFGRVDGDSKIPMLSESLKVAVAKVKSLPAVISVKDDKATWVLHVSDKKDTEYYDFNEIKSQVEAMIRSQKFQAILGKEMESLRKRYPVNIEESLLAEKPVVAEIAPQEEPKSATV